MIKNQVFKFCDNYRQKTNWWLLAATLHLLRRSNTLAAHKCDVIMGVPPDDDLV
jgi:aspartyl/asparaginyl beta-hydroxylase (cupin superfamily)